MIFLIYLAVYKDYILQRCAKQLGGKRNFQNRNEGVVDHVMSQMLISPRIHTLPSQAL